MKTFRIRDNCYFAGKNEENVMKHLISLLSGSEIVTDLGAGSHPFQTDFEKKGCSYVSIDIEGEQTYILNLNSDALPFADASVDVVLLCQTLEHIYETQFVLKEINRVIKPGGYVFISTPFVHGEHGIPYDFHRYTSFFYKQLQASFGRNLLSLTSGVYGPGNILLLFAYYLDYGSFFLPYKILVSPLIILLNCLIRLRNGIATLLPKLLRFIAKESIASDYVALYQKR